MLLLLKVKVFDWGAPVYSIEKINLQNFLTKKFDVCQKANSKFVQILFVLWRKKVFLSTMFLTSLSHSTTKKVLSEAPGSNKKSSTVKLFKFRALKTQQRLMLQEELNIPETEFSSFVDSLRKFRNLRYSENVFK